MAENRELALVLKLVADQFQSELKKSGGLLGEFNTFIKDWKTQVALAGTALFAIAKSTANFGEEALKTSQRIGLTVEKTTALQYAAGLADVPVTTLERGLQTLAQRAVEAARGSGEGAQVFTQLGLSATNAAGQVKPLDQLFFEMQDRMKGMTNQAQFVDAGMTAFGKSFMELTPLIKQGSAATKEAGEEGKRFGVVMSQEQAVAADKFNNELKKLDAQMNGVKLTIGKALIPTLSQLIELFRTSAVGSGFGAGLKAVGYQIILLNVALKELQANWQFLFGTGKDALSFGQLGDRIKEIEAGGQKQLFELRHPGVLSPEGPGSGGGAAHGGGSGQTGGSDAVAAKLKARNEALEKFNKLAREAAAGPNQYFLAFDRKEQFRLEDEAAAERELENRNRLAREAAAGPNEYFLAYDRKEQFKREDEAAEEQRRQRWAEYAQFEAQMLEGAAAAQQKASKGFFEGWVEGMDRYVGATDSAFGLAADMARRTAQAMEQNFRTFFFDLFEGRVKSMEDVLQGLSNFVTQIASQIAAQFATKAVLGAFGFGGGLPGFATGGSFTVGGFGGQDSQLVAFRASPDERVTVEQPGQRAAAQQPVIQVQIFNQSSNTDVQARPSSNGRGLDIWMRDKVRGMIAGGEMDKAMRSRFNLTPGEA